MRSCRTTTAAIVLVLSFLPAFAGPLEDGLAAAERGDHTTALRILRQLATAGNPVAQTEVAKIYSLGLGVPKNSREAVMWYRWAATKGHPPAQDALGIAYYHGEGVPQNFQEAVKWLQAAAEQGVANSQSKLGFIYENGEGIPQNYVLAHMWFDLAASQGYPLGDRDRVAAHMTPSQIAEAQTLAREWKPKP